MWRLIVATALICHATGYVFDSVILNDSKEPYTFEDIFDPSLRPRSFSPRWTAVGDKFYYRDRLSGNVTLYDPATSSSTILFDSEMFTNLSVGAYYVSSDLERILYAYDTRSQWRHSFSARYKVQDRAGTVFDFPGPGAGELHNALLQYAGWAPTGTALSFVFENNLYYHDILSGLYQQITTDGTLEHIFNGVPDWLYEEDVISDSVSHYWSTNGSYICYARINDSQVPFISWPLYGDKSNVFGSTREIAYPKAGDINGTMAGPNSFAELFVYDVRNNVTKAILPPTEFLNVDHYYLQVEWMNDITVLITWADRIQQHMLSVTYDVTSQSPLSPSRTCLDYTETNGWLEVPPPTPLFINEDEYITIHPRPVGERGNWRHLAVVSCSNGSVSFLTNGLEEIDNIYAYNPTQRIVYYSSTHGVPTEKHIMKLNIENETADCLTCTLPDSCQYVTSSFSSNAMYYFQNCRGPEIPTFTLKSTGNNFNDVVFEDNADVKVRLEQKALPTREFRSITINNETEQMELFIPPNHTSGKKYPLLIYAYAGPGSQRVMKTFPIGGSTNNWLTYLKSTHKIAIASVDSRGALGQGDAFKFKMYKRLGDVEVQDQIALGRFFETVQGSVLDIVNNAKSKAIFGWSYGGGTAAHAIGDPTDTIKCGVSVAPVTTKAYYDTAYTERYLGLATGEEGAAAYNRTDVMNKVNNFRNKKFMIAHGIADDNVHFMHATQLIKSLAEANILFTQNVYVDQNHGISNPQQSRHLYRSMTEFLLNDCWGTITPYDGDAAEETTTGPPLFCASVALSSKFYFICWMAIIAKMLFC